MKKYQVLESDKFKYISLVLLNEIINFQHYFNVRSTGEEIFIERYLRFMYDKGVLAIEKGKYIPTEAGRGELVNLYAKYNEFLKLYDIFCAVDLERGEFAFSYDNEEISDADYDALLKEERFSDIRVAVAEFKGINPMEMVFLSFLNEGRFDVGVGRWEYALTGDAVWNEIEDILNSAITVEYLTEDNVLENVIREGSAIALELIKNSEAYEDEDDEEVYEDDEVVEYMEFVEIVEMPYYEYEYYEPYYDPYYISPIWAVPIILLW